MREFIMLIAELLFVAAMQVVLVAILEESGHKWVIKLINIACILICYFLLLRYVYNNFYGAITTFVNFF